jgi:hypothetical protein
MASHKATTHTPSGLMKLIGSLEVMLLSLGLSKSHILSVFVFVF